MSEESKEKNEEVKENQVNEVNELPSEQVVSDNDSNSQETVKPTKRPVFDDIMFGRRKNVQKEEPSAKEEESIEMQMMEQINDIVQSLEELKPMLKEFTPIVNYIKKRIKL
ncbi:hypothetical protein LC087_01535 [Bacillus carboniphilus]|uniref:Spore coat protein n=1 Tax=Bacillus carboniphilus TaxID=86663 RepID=A0ABY9JU83_9BACI|nr:hypothetical protein [Bacillus carboniphilus]WLR42940.1 hypothetical protein LC087_01535 [Bacillus carboniphilus]